MSFKESCIILPHTKKVQLSKLRFPCEVEASTWHLFELKVIPSLKSMPSREINSKAWEKFSSQPKGIKMYVKQWFIE